MKKLSYMYLRRYVFKGRGRAYERGVQPIHWSGPEEPIRGRESLKGPIAWAIDVLFWFDHFWGCIFNSNPQFCGPKAVLFRFGKSLLEALDRGWEVYGFFCRFPLVGITYTKLKNNRHIYNTFKRTITFRIYCLKIYNPANSSKAINRSHLSA